MNKHLHQEVEDLQQKQKMICHEIDSLHLAIKNKDTEMTLLKENFETFKKEMISKEQEIHKLKSELKNSSILRDDKSTAVLPCQRQMKLGIKAEMKVKVITRDNSSGKELANGGSEVRAILTCNEGECPVTNYNDGTYTVSVIPQQLGQHQLFIAVNGRYIQGSPFSLHIVPQRDYTKLNQPVQTITGIDGAMCIAFSDNGDMFVTSADNCIHVCDESGNEKTTIGSLRRGRGELQFQYPHGIAINGEIVYVAERDGNRMHQLTTGGEFIGIFGELGSGIGQFTYPHDVKISPDGKIYVADKHCNRVQVFNPDWSVSHVINKKSSGYQYLSWPQAIAFDPLSGNVHVTCDNTNGTSVAVFTPSGEFIRDYGKEVDTDGGTGIAIDPSGYSLVVDRYSSKLFVFDPNGTLIHSVVGEFMHCYGGITISPFDGSLLITDLQKGRLFKY